MTQLKSVCYILQMSQAEAPLWAESSSISKLESSNDFEMKEALLMAMKEDYLTDIGDENILPIQILDLDAGY